MAGRKRSYEITFKLHVVDYAVSKSTRAAARKFDVDERRIREWRSLKAELEEHSSKKQKRFLGGGRKQIMSDEFEAELLEWIDTMTQQHLRVTSAAIQRKAIAMYAESMPGPSFDASDREASSTPSNKRRPRINAAPSSLFKINKRHGI